MGQPAARQGDKVIGQCTHTEMISSPGGPVPTPVPGHPFSGTLNDGLSQNVKIMGMLAATKDSTAQNMPSHVPMSGPFQTPPQDKAQITQGSQTVTINGKPAAYNGCTAQTCDEMNSPGQVLASGTVLIG